MRGGYTNYNLPKVTENNKYAGGYYRPARRNGDGLGFGGLMGVGCGASRPQGEIPAGFVHQGNNRNHVEQRNGVNTLVKNTSNEIRDAEVEGISKPNQGRSGRPLSPHRGRLDPSLRQGASMPGSFFFLFFQCRWNVQCGCALTSPPAFFCCLQGGIYDMLPFAYMVPHKRR